MVQYFYVVSFCCLGCVGELNFASDVGDIAVEDVILEQLLKIFSQLLEMKVGLVGCQKVIHPLAKDYLREKVSFTEKKPQKA